MIKSRTRAGRLANVFHYGDPDEKEMHVQLARLCVLYDDLMLEFVAANEDSIALLDKSSVDSRRFYFVRRTLGTLSELRGALAVLEKSVTFLARKASWKEGARKGWEASIAFFAANHQFLKEWRNDIGGHFHDSAAAYAIDNIESDTVGLIELYRTDRGANVRMKFAYDLVAVAMIKNRDVANQTIDDFLQRAFTFVKDAVGYATDAVQIVTSAELFDRFG